MPEVSLDQIISQRALTVRTTQKGDALYKIAKGPASWNKENRSARFVMTAEVVDRYGDVVVTKGVDTAEFEKNPIALWAHDNRAFPIGQWQNLSKIVNSNKKRLEGDCVLSPEGTTPETDILAALVAAGTVRACSIGFMPKAWESIKDEKDRWTGYKFMESELLECSPCNVPANPAALIKAAGGDDRSALQAIELILDEWALTPEGLIVPRKEFERAYEVVKDKNITIHEVSLTDETEEDPDAAAPSLNTLDIEAAVARGFASVVDTAMAQIAKMFGKTMPETKTEEPEAPEAEEPVNQSVEEPADGEETDEEFQARMAAHGEDLADEAEEKALRERAEAFA